MFIIQDSHRSWKTWKGMEFMISISRSGKSWNYSEGHGKAICFQKMKRQKDKKFKKITEESETGFNFRQAHTLCIITLEICY